MRRVLRHVNIGEVYGRLTVKHVLPVIRPQLHFGCLCSCGKWAVVRKDCLYSGHTQSCGCLVVESSSARLKAMRTQHGLSNTSTHICWVEMRKRCSKVQNAAYARYGGRGIGVAEEWSDFERFLDDMGMRPDGHSLDRIDVNAGYSKSNCRWATPKEQNRNKRNNRLVCVDGVRMCVAEAAERLGMKHGTLLARIKRGKPTEGVTYDK